MTLPLNYSLENFNGPLELLLYLVQKDEVDICDILLKELTKQFHSEDIDCGSEFLNGSSILLLLKSRRLLPQNEEQLTVEELDLRWEMMQQLIEYHRFKEAAHTLLSLEADSKTYFPRQLPALQKKDRVLSEIKLEELEEIVQQLIAKASPQIEKIVEEERFDIQGALLWLRENSVRRESIPFEEIFSVERPKEELIVFFLATLELMKLQEIVIVKQDLNLSIYAKPKSI